jgi:HEAT repeat protein
MEIEGSMNQLLGWLAEGDLRTDGLSDQAVALVLAHPELVEDLLEGLAHPDGALRGHTADAMEKIARTRPDLFSDRLAELQVLALTDDVPAVRFHLVMLLGHLACYEPLVDELVPILVQALDDPSAFVRSWAIAGLGTIGRAYLEHCGQVVSAISGLQGDASIAVRTRARKALVFLTNPAAPIPPGWVKNERLIERLQIRP